MKSRLNLILMLAILALSFFASPAWNSPSLCHAADPKLLLSITDLGLSLPDTARSYLFVAQKEKQATDIDLTIKDGKTEQKSVLSRNEYHRYRDRLLALLLQQEAHGRKQTKCRPSLKIDLLELKESLVLCKGEAKPYYKVRGILSGLD